MSRSGERDADLPVREDIIASEGSNDGGNEDHNAEADWVSDCESSSSVNPIGDRTNIQPDMEVDGPIRSDEREGDTTHRQGFNVAPLVDQPKSGFHGLIRIDESDRIHEHLKNRFISGLNHFGVNAEVVDMKRNFVNATGITLAKLKTFLIYEKAVNNQNRGHTNVKGAWFGASKDQINNIITHGFSHQNIDKNGAFGYGIYLATDNSLLESVKSSTSDADGVRHILYCRVISGKSEPVRPGSKQWHPTSNEFHSGVDNFESPKRIIVWSTQINTHILPECVISFKILSGYNGPETAKFNFSAPLSRSITIKAVITELSKILPPEATINIHEYRRKYLEQQISRQDMLVGIRNVSGDRLLLMIMKDLNEQEQLKVMSQGGGSQGQ